MIQFLNLKKLDPTQNQKWGTDGLQLNQFNLRLLHFSSEVMISSNGYITRETNGFKRSDLAISTSWEPKKSSSDMNSGVNDKELEISNHHPPNLKEITRECL